MKYRSNKLRPSVPRPASYSLVRLKHRIDRQLKGFRDATGNRISKLRFATLELRQRSHRDGQKLRQLGLGQAAQGTQIAKITLARRNLNELVHLDVEQVSGGFEGINLRGCLAALPHSHSAGRNSDKTGQFPARHTAGLAMHGDLAGNEATQDASAHPRHPHMTDHFASPTPMPSQVALLVCSYRLTHSSSVNREGTTSMHTKGSFDHPPGRHPVGGHLSFGLGQSMIQVACLGMSRNLNHVNKDWFTLIRSQKELINADASMASAR